MGERPTIVDPNDFEVLARHVAACIRQGSATDAMAQNAEEVARIAAARIEALEAAIKRQAGAAKTLRQFTLEEVQHLKDKDRSEYNAAKTLESERHANAILTDEIEVLEARIEALEADLARAVEALEWYSQQMAVSAKPTIDAQWAQARMKKDGGDRARAALSAIKGDG